MYNNTPLKVLEQIYLIPGIHKREMARNLKLSMPSVDNALNKINKVVKRQKSGNQIKYFLDFSKHALTPLLSNVEYLRFEKLPAKIKISINSFLAGLKQKPLIALIFGSYAKGNYTSTSDLDILLVFERIENSKDIENIARKISMATNTKISPVYLNFSLFKESFYDSRKEFFRGVRRDKIIIIGTEWWRQLENEEA